MAVGNWEGLLGGRSRGVRRGQPPVTRATPDVVAPLPQRTAPVTPEPAPTAHTLGPWVSPPAWRHRVRHFVAVTAVPFGTRLAWARSANSSLDGLSRRELTAMEAVFAETGDFGELHALATWARRFDHLDVSDRFADRLFASARQIERLRRGVVSVPSLLAEMPAEVAADWPNLARLGWCVDSGYGFMIRGDADDDPIDTDAEDRRIRLRLCASFDPVIQLALGMSHVYADSRVGLQRAALAQRLGLSDRPIPYLRWTLALWQAVDNDVLLTDIYDQRRADRQRPTFAVAPWEARRGWRGEDGRQRRIDFMLTRYWERRHREAIAPVIPLMVQRRLVDLLDA